MSVTPFVPADFIVPQVLKTEDSQLRMLTVNDVVRDFDAVMSSVEHCKTIWGGKWPEGLTLEQNLIDLGWHQKEFQTRRSFTYTVVDPADSMVLGCVYIMPTRKVGFDAEVYLWIRESHLASGMESRLFKAVQDWVTSAWPFTAVAYPGRTISLVEWKEIESL
ncbi:GNAT family N-acetyltransferase [bacterium]|nr:GNAT family N-acetyltransferase [bacterium]